MDLLLILLGIFPLLITSSRSVNNLKLHSHMTEDEREEIFGVTDINDVPEYGLVPLSYSTNCGNNFDCVKFNAFDEIISLRLREIDHLLFSKKTPIFFAEGIGNHSKMIKYKYVDTSAIHNALKFYEDSEKRSGFSMERSDDGKIRFTGLLEDRLVLRVIPDRLHYVWEEIAEMVKLFIPHSKEESNTTNVLFHIIFRRAFIGFRLSEKLFESKKKRNGLPSYSGPDVIYPRILVFVNFKTRFMSDRDHRFFELLVYLVCFWNAVNMKYIEFEKPRIRLRIAGLVIGNNNWSAPYLTKSIRPRSTIAFSGHALHRYRKFMRENDPLPGSWDIAISQSDIQLCPTINCTSNSTLGVSYVGQTCNNISNHWTLALVVDKHNFQGVQTAAHEIGHLFGASHDGQGSCLCNDEGFIMSPSETSKSLKSDSWSECSKVEILRRLRNRPDTCWDISLPINKTDEVPELLPGHIISLQEQCKTRGFHDFCFEKTTCKNLYCRYRHFQAYDFLFGCHDVGIPFAGSHCGNRMHCKYQQCIPINGSMD